MIVLRQLRPVKHFDYQIRKKLTYIDSRFGITSLLGNIQNTFVDSEKNTYVSFSGYPSFETTNTNRSKTFNSSSGVSTNQYTVNINDLTLDDISKYSEYVNFDN